MVILVIVLFLSLLTSLYVVYNLNKKYSELESIAMENQEFIISIRNRVLSQRSYLRQLDRIGSFESDDEVGIFFKELKKIITDISVYLELEEEVEEEPTSKIRSRITGV